MDVKDMTPTAADITAEAIKYIEREPWYASNQNEDDDAPESSCWLALLYDTEGDFLTSGVGSTAARATAEAWLWRWHPMGDEAWDGVMREFKPDDQRFELFPPGTWETDSPEWDMANPSIGEDQAPPAAWVERRVALQR
jgi:hypothetical protein